MYGENEDGFSVDDWRNEPSNFISQSAKWSTDLGTGSTTTPTSHKSTTGVGSVIRIQVDPYQLAELSNIKDHHERNLVSQSEASYEPQNQTRRMELINRYASDVEESDCEGMFSLEHYSKLEARKTQLSDHGEGGDSRIFDIEHESGYYQPSIQKATFSGSGKKTTPMKGAVELEDEASEPYTTNETGAAQYAPRRFNDDDPFSLDAQQTDREFSDQDRYTSSMERPEAGTDSKLPPIFEESELASEFDQSLMHQALKLRNSTSELVTIEAEDLEFGAKSVIDPEPDCFELGAEFEKLLQGPNVTYEPSTINLKDRVAGTSEPVSNLEQIPKSQAFPSPDHTSNSQKSWVLTSPIAPIQGQQSPAKPQLISQPEEPELEPHLQSARVPQTNPDEYPSARSPRGDPSPSDTSSFTYQAQLPILEPTQHSLKQKMEALQSPQKPHTVSKSPEMAYQSSGMPATPFSEALAVEACQLTISPTILDQTPAQQTEPTLTLKTEFTPTKVLPSTEGKTTTSNHPSNLTEPAFVQPEEPTSKDIAELDDFFDKNPLDITALPEVTVDIKDQLKDHSLEAELIKVEYQLKNDFLQAAKNIEVPSELLKASREILQKKRSSKLLSNILDLESMISQGSKLAVLASSLKAPLNSLLGKRSPRDSSVSENKHNDEYADWNSPYRHSVHTAKSYLEKISSPLEKNLQSIADWEIKSSNPMAAFTSSNRDRNMLYTQDGLDELEAQILGRALSPTLNKPVQKFGQSLFSTKPSSKDSSLAHQLKAALAGKPIPSQKPTPAKASPGGAMNPSGHSSQVPGTSVPPQTPQKKKKYWMGPIPNPQTTQKETFSDNFRDSAKPTPSPLPTTASHHPSGGYVPKPKPYWDRMVTEAKPQTGPTTHGGPNTLKMPTAKVLHSPAVVPGPFERLQAKFGQKTHGEPQRDTPEPASSTAGPFANVDTVVVVLPPTKPMPGKGRVV